MRDRHTPRTGGGGGAIAIQPGPTTDGGGGGVHFYISRHRDPGLFPKDPGL